MSISIDQIRSALTEDVRDRILSKPNVWAVGAGLQYIDGVEQQEPAITVRVESKVSESELSLEDRIPQSLSGVPVDVIEAERPAPEFGDDYGHGVQTTDVRPTVGGVSVKTGDGVIGTQGGIFNDDTGNRVILTNEHVVAPDGDPMYQYDAQIGTVQEQYEGYDAALIDVGTESDASSIMAGGITIGTPEEPQVGEWYLVCGHRTAWHGSQCTATDFYLEGYDGRGVEYRRDDFDEGSGNSGSCHGRYDPETNTFHPVSLHYSGSSAYGYDMTFSSVEEAVGDLTPASQTTEPPGLGSTANAYFDAAVHDIVYDSANREFDISFICGNLGGENTVNDTVALEESDGTVIESIDFTANSLDFFNDSWSVPDTRAGETLYVTTRDNPENSVPLQSETANYSPSITMKDTVLTQPDIETLKYSISNNGEIDSDPVLVELDIDGNVVKSENIALNSGESKKRGYIIDSGKWEPGSHTATVTTPDETTSVQFNVYEESTGSGEAGMGLAGMGTVGFGYSTSTTTDGTFVTITGTNSPIDTGQILDVTADLENTTDAEVTDTIELRII